MSSAAMTDQKDSMTDSTLDTQRINEEYKIWKKNTPLLYDLAITHALEWPSLTVQWLPDRVIPSNSPGYSLQRLLLGTHTGESEQNYVHVAEVRVPLPDAEIEAGLYGSTDGDDANTDYSGLYGRVEIVQSLAHSGEVNRARYMPQNPNLIATKSPNSEVFVFDRSKNPAKPPRHQQTAYEYKLTGHTREGYGLSWSSLSQGHLLSGSEDKLICFWDVQASPAAGGNTLGATTVFRGHTDIVEDVAWSCHHASVFASCGDDALICLWDLRKNKEPTQKIGDQHSAEINCLAFNPENPNLFVTGSADKSVGLFDLRQLKTKLHSFEGHSDQVFTVAWNPHNATILASCSSDRRVNVWDLTRIGEEQDPEDAEDGPPELLFIHGGHTDKVADVAWNPHVEEDWLVASVADDNVLQVWQMAASIYDNEDQEDKEKKVEMDQLE